jgi:hypothetical protein
MFRTFSLTLATVAAMGLAGAMTPASAGGYTPPGGYCPPKPPGTVINIHKPVRIYKPVRINNSVRINKTININKPIRISKTIIINKGGVDVEAVARAAASARSESSAIAYASGGSAIVDVEAPRGGDFGSVSAQEPCVDQWVILVKAIHAECVSSTGTRHPATRMRPETWVDSTMNAEIYRCLAGSYLHVKIGDVVDSEQGMAGVFVGAQELKCAPGQALRHYRDGTVKCAVAERVSDCAERRNMRRYGIGDLFFSYRAKICARVASWAATHGSSSASSGAEVEVQGSFEGGVGQ